MEKYCAVCGRLFAREVVGEYYDVIRGGGMSYYAWIRRKYCPTCARETKQMQTLHYLHRSRALKRKWNAELREQISLLRNENAYLRQCLKKEGAI